MNGVARPAKHALTPAADSTDAVSPPQHRLRRNLRLYPWFQAGRSLLFWQAAWFLYLEAQVSAALALSIAVLYDVGVVLFEVPTGYVSDRFGRRATLCASALASCVGCALLFSGLGFAVLATGQLLLGLGAALASGTDTSLLYESLDALDEGEQVGRHEVRAWRAIGLALAGSALIGGLCSLWSLRVPYLLSAGAAFAAIGIAFLFAEPPRQRRAAAVLPQLRACASLLRDSVLRWVLVVTVLIVLGEDLPYVYQQPYVRALLADLGWQAHTPWITGAVIAVTMAVAAGGAGLGLRAARRYGPMLALLGCTALGWSVLMAMASWQHAAAVGLLAMRMLPGAAAAPLLAQTVHPRVPSALRATYFSLQSLVGRLVLSGTVLLSATAVAGRRSVDGAALDAVLPIQAVCAGLVLVALVAVRPRSPGS